MICIDGKFEQDVLDFYKEHGVEPPVEGEEYTIREELRHSNGKIGYRLVEIINPQVPINHSVLGLIMYEPSFHSERFAEFDLEKIYEDEQIEENVDDTILTPM